MDARGLGSLEFSWKAGRLSLRFCLQLGVTWQGPLAAGILDSWLHLKWHGGLWMSCHCPPSSVASSFQMPILWPATWEPASDKSRWQLQSSAPATCPDSPWLHTQPISKDPWHSLSTVMLRSLKTLLEKRTTQKAAGKCESRFGIRDPGDCRDVMFSTFSFN